MKKHVTSILYLVLLLSAACSRSPQEKAVAAIVHHLEKTLKDPSSYIPVQYAIEEVFESKPAYLSSDSAGRNVLDPNTAVPAENPAISGWRIVHKFKCRSESGVVKDTQLTFFVNRNYNIENIR